MSLLDVLVSPGATVGCVAGVAAAFFLHWLFPAQDLLFVQALLVVGASVVGLVVEHRFTDRPPK